MLTLRVHEYNATCKENRYCKKTATKFGNSCVLLRNGRDGEWVLYFVIFLIEIRAPVSQIKHGEHQRKDNAGDDVNSFRAQRVSAYPGTATRFCWHPVVPLLATITTIFHEDYLGTGRD